MTSIPLVGPLATTSGEAPQPARTAALSSDFETFLQMLTVQARYQDPLEPLSSSDYAAQLAQFSMVEQQVLTNDQLGNLAGLIGGRVGKLYRTADHDFSQPRRQCRSRRVGDLR